MEWGEYERVCVVYKVWEWNGENVNGYVMILLCLEWFEKEWKGLWNGMGRI